MFVNLKLPCPCSGCNRDVHGIKMKECTAWHALQLMAYGDSLEKFLSTARAMNDDFAILCDREPGWVEKCAAAYLPRLLSFFTDGKLRVKVIYVNSGLQDSSVDKEDVPHQPVSLEQEGAHRCSWWTRTKSCLGMCSTKCKRTRTSPSVPDKFISRAAHLVSMKVQGTRLASRRPLHGAISIGLAGPQQEAFKLYQEVMATGLVAKMVTVPPKPTVEQLLLRLQLDALLLPVYTLVGRSFQVDMSGQGDALENLATALRMPRLSRPSFPRFAWDSKQSIPSPKVMAYELGEMRLDVTDSVLFAGPLV